MISLSWGLLDNYPILALIVRRGLRFTQTNEDVNLSAQDVFHPLGTFWLPGVVGLLVSF